MSDEPASLETIHRRLTKVERERRAFRADVDQRFDAVDQRFDAVDQRFEAVDQRFDVVGRRITEVELRLGTAIDELRGTLFEVRDMLRARTRSRPRPPRRG